MSEFTQEDFKASDDFNGGKCGAYPIMALFKTGRIGGMVENKNWKWCDVLYMAPPAMVKMAKVANDPKYLLLMNAKWWGCYHHLYPEEDSLFYRDDRYVPNAEGTERRTTIGMKVFWGRGNGWVIGGLAQILPLIPEEYPTKENSSSAFFTFALAWGINAGYLDKNEYSPKVKKAWMGLNDCMTPDGMLGFVQPVGHDPRNVGANDLMEYGTAAYLLAAEQMLKIIE